MELPKAGEGVIPSEEQLDEFVRQMNEQKPSISKLFYYQGFIAALEFSRVLENAETFGLDLVQFAENDYLNTLDRLP